LFTHSAHHFPEQFLIGYVFGLLAITGPLANLPSKALSSEAILRKLSSNASSDSICVLSINKGVLCQSSVVLA